MRTRDRRTGGRRGMILMVAGLTVVLITTLTMVGLGRSAGELSASMRFGAVQRAFFAAEAGLDQVLAFFEPGRFEDRQQQADVLAWISQPGELPMPAELDAFLVAQLPDASRMSLCDPQSPVTESATGQRFPVCVEGEAAGVRRRIRTVLELPNSPQPGSGLGVMPISGLFLRGGSKVFGDVVVLRNGDRFSSVFLGSKAKVERAMDGTGGRILIRDLPASNLDLGPGGALPGMLDDASMAPLDPWRPVLAGVYDKNLPPFPVTPYGVPTNLRRAFREQLLALGSVTESTMGGLIQGRVNGPAEPRRKVMRLDDFLAEERGMSSQEIADQYAALDRFAALRTLPDLDPLNLDQVPPIQINGQTVNRGGWRIAPAGSGLIKLVGSAGEELPISGVLPGGVWVIDSMQVGSGAELLFDERSRVYVTGQLSTLMKYNVGIGQTRKRKLAVNMGGRSLVRAVQDGASIPNGVQVVVPCLERETISTCLQMDESGLCLDADVANPDLDGCAATSDVAMRIGSAAKLDGSVHAPSADVILGGAGEEDTAAAYPPLSGADAAKQMTTRRTDAISGGRTRETLATYSIPMDGEWKLVVGNRNYNFYYVGADGVLEDPGYMAKAYVQTQVTVTRPDGSVESQTTSTEALPDLTSIRSDQLTRPPAGGQWLLESIWIGSGDELVFDPDDPVQRMILDGSVTKQQDPLLQRALLMGASSAIRNLDSLIEIYPAMADEEQLLSIHDTASILMSDGQSLDPVWDAAELPGEAADAAVNGFLIADHVVVGTSARLTMPTEFGTEGLGASGAPQELRVKYWGGSSAQ